MTTITLIAEPFPDWEATVNTAASRDLAQALADTAPRSCSVRYLLARGANSPELSSPLIRTEHLPFRASLLPLMWQNGTTARPLDGEFVHSLTPLVPLRSRGEDDGSQTSVTISHSIAWDSPAVLGSAQARLYRAFTKRAVKHADVILTPTHATARVLQDHYGSDLPVQVFPLAPPTEYLRPDDALARRTALGIPDHYAVTTATASEHGRLSWIIDALLADPKLPTVVVLTGVDPALDVGPEATTAIPAELQGRIIVATPRDLGDVGAALTGASLLLQPQDFLGTGYTLLGALSAAVPVLHSGHPAAEEIVLDAGVMAPGAGEFAAEFSRLFRDPNSLSYLAVLARDRSRSYSWRGTAWHLWETHANL
ncbi:glycosyltransferase family 4 protein [Leucobacter insecticola]|uniref:Glycosyltransferase family 4 protein n=1 Tax=Leucobacter insecticola TaxID=2714934 RepID=A0A6G8FHL2_9MICO|nr:glycosyltransferase family 4 protein [Leucobacter insecticola]QIM15847.1 glycosyltransferase family 4 protein [Leucobacter insecticola]